MSSSWCPESWCLGKTDFNLLFTWIWWTCFAKQFLKYYHHLEIPLTYLHYFLCLWIFFLCCPFHNWHHLCGQQNIFLFSIFTSFFVTKCHIHHEDQSHNFKVNSEFLVSEIDVISTLYLLSVSIVLASHFFNIRFVIHY